MGDLSKIPASARGRAGAWNNLPWGSSAGRILLHGLTGIKGSNVSLGARFGPCHARHRAHRMHHPKFPAKRHLSRAVLVALMATVFAASAFGAGLDPRQVRR